jgi:hypothetical protein
LFSRTYELPPQTDRFASTAFSWTYKSLFSQFACFHKHLRCPLVFFMDLQIPRVSPLDAPITIHYSLPTVFSHAIVSPS